jgi:hypothetical protein
MSNSVVLVMYGSAMLLALALLYAFEPIRWYWHAIAVAAALALGLTPLPAHWQTRTTDALTGCVFLLLFTWGVCSSAFRNFHRAHHV